MLTDAFIVFARIKMTGVPPRLRLERDDALPLIEENKCVRYDHALFWLNPLTQHSERFLLKRGVISRLPLKL